MAPKRILLMMFPRILFLIPALLFFLESDAQDQLRKDLIGSWAQRGDSTPTLIITQQDWSSISHAKERPVLSKCPYQLMRRPQPDPLLPRDIVLVHCAKETVEYTVDMVSEERLFLSGPWGGALYYRTP
jgi:hypothetical protein